MDTTPNKPSERPRGKIRGNGDKTLPIEDWAKGLSRVFSQRKNDPPKRPQRIEEVTSASNTRDSRPAALDSPSTTTSTQFITPTRTPSQPVEDWMRDLPTDQPTLSPRSPLRISIYEGSDSSKSSIAISESSEPSPSDSGTQSSDWGSDLGRNSPVAKLLNEITPGDRTTVSSNGQETISAEYVDEGSLTIPDCTPRRKTDLKATWKMNSLRCLFFSGSMASREAPKRFSLLSHITSARSRQPSTVSSVDSFITANDGSEIKVADNTKYEDHNDMGIDEDYTKQETVDELEVTPEHAALRHLLGQLFSQETITEIQDIDHQTDTERNSGTESLEDLLAQIALSSPYTSSNSDSSSQNDSQMELPETSLSDEEPSPQDTDSIPDESTLEYQPVHPAKHYKMINGIIVQYDPWRMSNQFNTANPSSYLPTANQLRSESTISDRSFQRTGDFLRSGDRWTYTGTQLTTTA